MPNCGQSYINVDYDVRSIDQASLAAIRSACSEFLERGGHLIPTDRLFWPAPKFEAAGRDAALAAQDHVSAFLDGQSHLPAGQQLDALCDIRPPATRSLIFSK